MATSKAPISCHVLDTVIGRPGASIKVTLSCLSAPNKQFGSIPHTFTGVTNSDGRIAEWENKFGVEVWSVVNEGSDEDEKNGTTVWSLKFDTEGYYGEGKTFWPGYGGSAIWATMARRAERRFLFMSKAAEALVEGRRMRRE
ncbi:hypothetical protein V501_08391 [Pseudogymnoascus sp. VKM F-4519 (FW-2642)]|nr:hypothetical protein V501_08391 [Pseudogymnoascus sp. VKM F-4519 (FW-2642)]